jgi:hypothetical protein
MKIIEVKHEQVEEYEIYSTDGGDFMIAEFSQWNRKNRDVLELITIKEFSLGKKIEKINYCEKFDAIEIHYYESNDNFAEFSQKINCRIDCVRFLLHAYNDNEIINDDSECKYLPGSGIGQPDTSKGNVVVGGD